MPFTKIDPTTPAGTEKKKFGDDRIRELKEQTIANFQVVTNYPAAEMPALRTAVWTTATRPAGAELVDRVTGYNTDLAAYEYYDIATTKWKVIAMPGLSAWNVAGRPSAPYVGQYGYNTDLAVVERWNGTKWQRISGGMRGDKKDWIGVYAQAEAENPGWVLCDGVQRTHPEGGTFTPPNLRDRFIVGAGTSYSVGATGGANVVTLGIDQIPSHNHDVGFPSGNNASMAALGWYWSSNGGGWQNPGTGYRGGGQAHENRPPYYALCYLYKL
ncbi:Phage Tail Collar domain protein [uncultured Sporomusa sp.]|uniref:Phage Tail Collar domain protein n=1 Tax=uncultured Sporomusa sp. TaxID=307249 RepID=A0A212LXT2_9FIRM|nr:hypothetical protein [uncultured Sporomusa sp.]SCM82403.1 Phage Tail Collar domain protein [uncultured Sporomusa sp.]